MNFNRLELTFKSTLINSNRRESSLIIQHESTGQTQIDFNDNFKDILYLNWKTLVALIIFTCFSFFSVSFIQNICTADLSFSLVKWTFCFMRPVIVSKIFRITKGKIIYLLVISEVDSG